MKNATLLLFLVLDIMEKSAGALYEKHGVEKGGNDGKILYCNYGFAAMSGT